MSSDGSKKRPDQTLKEMYTKWHPQVLSDFEEEMPKYQERVRRTGTTTLMANYLAAPELAGDTTFGGAWAVRGDGTAIASLPLGREGMLVAEV